MSSTAPLVTIFGGAGFVGRYIAQRMARQGWRVRVACRRPNESMFVQTYGAVGQVVPVLANVRYPESVAQALDGADAVVNCVGLLAEAGKQKFNAVQVEGATNIATAAAEAGVQTLVHLSAIGADANSGSDYARTKAAGEAAVLEAFPGAHILRPSVIFGNEDGFFNRFAGLARMSPVLPITGGATKFQPVFVDDVAAVAEKAILGQAAPGIYELGGPEAESLSDLIAKMLHVVKRRRLVMNLPFWMAGIQASVLDFAFGLTFGLYENSLLSADQVKLLKQDNVASGDYPGLADLGITPTYMDAVLEGYLYSYRPEGQYTALTESAENLRG